MSSSVAEDMNDQRKYKLFCFGLWDQIKVETHKGLWISDKSKQMNWFLSAATNSSALLIKNNNDDNDDDFTYVAPDEFDGRTVSID